MLRKCFSKKSSANIWPRSQAGWATWVSSQSTTKSSRLCDRLASGLSASKILLKTAISILNRYYDFGGDLKKGEGV